MMKIEVQKAEKCAWRARYLKVNGVQMARIGIDPNDGTKPQLFFSLPTYYRRGSGQRTWCAGRGWRINLPTVSWATAARSRIGMVAYRAVRRFWHNMDGRYGWGSK